VRVTTKPPNPAVRRTARLLALVPALLVTCLAGAAHADPPESWENTPSVSPLHVILLLGVAPVALFVIITLLVMLPGMSRGSTYSPSQVWRGEPEWFGGPATGLAAVDQAEQPAPTGSGAPGSDRGGAGGRW
jgi:hypothetical protein